MTTLSPLLAIGLKESFITRNVSEKDDSFFPSIHPFFFYAHDFCLGYVDGKLSFSFKMSESFKIDIDQQWKEPQQLTWQNVYCKRLN